MGIGMERGKEIYDQVSLGNNEHRVMEKRKTTSHLQPELMEATTNKKTHPSLHPLIGMARGEGGKETRQFPSLCHVYWVDKGRIPA